MSPPPKRPPLDYEDDRPRRRPVPAWHVKLGITLWVVIALLLALVFWAGYLRVHNPSFWR